MTGAEGFNRAASLYLAQQVQAANPIQAPHSLSESDGTKNTNASSPLDQSSASISGLGQLFSNLQQLQNQNPNQFVQVIDEVICMLIHEAQQQIGSASQYLTSLANSFQQASPAGGLPMLYVPSPPELQAYGSNAQSFTDLNGNTASAFQDLFASLANKVSASLGS